MLYKTQKEFLEKVSEKPHAKYKPTDRNWLPWLCQIAYSALTLNFCP